MRSKAHSLLLSIFLAFVFQSSFSQTIVRGKVLDIETNEGVSFCKVFFTDGQKTTSTDFEGNFKIQGPPGSKEIAFAFYGYDTLFRTVIPDSNQYIVVELSPKKKTIQKVVLKGNQENPAYRVMRQVIANKEKNDGYLLKAFQHESYSKIEIDVDQMSQKFQQRKPVAKILAGLDSNNRLKSEKGTLLLPVFFSETHSEYFYNHNPNLYRENILRTRISGVGITDGTFTSQLIGSYFQTYNAYNNWLNIAGRDFVSPVTDRWKSYYDYRLDESLEQVGDKLCYKLSFEPKREQDLAFSGTMWITQDEYAIKQLDVKIGKSANLNFIEKVNITQEFTQVVDSGAWLANKTRIVLDVEEIGNNPGIIAKSYVSNYNYVINKVKPIPFFDSKIVLDEDALDKDPSYWNTHRADSLTDEELRVYGMIDTIKSLPVVKTYTELVDLAISGYKSIGKIDIGPPLGLYAFNDIEGHRISLGVRTNAKLSKKFFARGNLAYGTEDATFKYKLDAKTRLVKRSYTILGASVSRDIEQIGVYNQFNRNNYLFNAFNRWGTLRQPFMLTEQKVYLNTDLFKGVRQLLSLERRNFDALFPFRYYKRNRIHLDSSLQVSELIIGYRFSFKESNLFNDFERISVPMANKPVFRFYGVFGFSNFLGGQFAYQKFFADIKHNFRLGVLGRTNYKLRAGFTPSLLPYPLLESHLGNRTIFYNEASFNMMGIFEFVSDRFASLSIYHDFDGLIANRVPLFKRLKWRFFATANLLTGGVSNQNRQIIPMTDENGRSLAQFNGLEPNKPYAEMGYGISNILKFIRIDFLHRVNYLQNGASPFGVKVSVQFSL